MTRGVAGAVRFGSDRDWLGLVRLGMAGKVMRGLVRFVSVGRGGAGHGKAGEVLIVKI